MKQLPEGWKTQNGLKMNMVSIWVNLKAGAKGVRILKVKPITILHKADWYLSGHCDFISGNTSRSSEHCLETPGEITVSSLPGVDSDIRGFCYCLPENVNTAKAVLIHQALHVLCERKDLCFSTMELLAGMMPKLYAEFPNKSIYTYGVDSTVTCPKCGASCDTTTETKPYTADCINCKFGFNWEVDEEEE